MRPASDRLQDILASRYDVTYTARALSDWDRETIPDVPLVAGRFNFSATKDVSGSGSATVLFADAAGRSRAPEKIGDDLSPFGNWLEVTCHISAGAWRSSTIIGKFEISAPRGADRGVGRLGQSRMITSETFTMQLDDAFLGTKSEPIEGVQQSTVGRPVRDELEELLGLPVSTDANALITSLTEYPQDRLKAAFDLVQLVGGVPYMRWDATVGIRPTVWPEPTFALRDGNVDGANGLLIRRVQVDEWDSKEVANRVVVTAETADQRPLRAERTLTIGKLRYGPRRTGAWGRRTKVYAISAFDTQQQVEQYADERFAADTLPRAVGVSIEMPVDPRLEPGDVGLLRTETVSGRIRIKTVDLTVGASTMKVSAYLA